MPKHNTNEELVSQYKVAKEQGNTTLANETLSRIIEQNTPMIYDRINALSLVRTNISKEDIEDMAQECMISLMQAVEKYDEKRAVFNTYAYEKVQFTILDWLENNHHLIHIPRQKQKEVAQYHDIVKEYKINNNDREPSDEYIKRMMGVDDNTYRDIKAAHYAYNIISFDKEIEQEEGNITVGDTIPDESNCFKKLIQNNKHELLQIILELNNRDERKVLIDYYFNDIPLVKIAENCGVTKQRINNIKKKAYEHLAKLPDVKNIAIELGINPLDF